jgi:hypothetical protein
MSRLAEEVLVFGRLAAFGIIVGASYWFVSYEPAGTVLLLAFGAASGVASVILWAGSRHVSAAGEDGDVAGATREGPFGDEHARIPAPAYAPFIVGVGLGVVAFGLAFGPLLLLTGIVVLVIGARYWLEAAMRDADASARPGADDG